MSRTRLVASAAAAVVMTLGLAGCGEAPPSGLDLPEYEGTSSAVSGKSGTELLEDAQAALAKAESVTLSGSTSAADQGEFGAELAFRGADGSGTYSIGDVEFTVLVVGGRSWYKGNDKAYAAFGVDTASVTRKIADRWIIDGSKNPKLAQLEVAGTREDLLADFVTGRGDPTVTGQKTIDGVATVGLQDESGTLYVDTKTLRPVRIVLEGDTGDGVQITYDEVQAPTAPPADQILDLADLR